MAEELANAGYSVVMLDLDSQTDLTDINLSQNEDSNLFDLLTGQKALEEVVIELPGKVDKRIIPGSARVDEIQTGVSNTLAELSRAGYTVSDNLLIVAGMLAEYKRTYPDLFFENYIGIDTAIPNAQFNQETMRDLPWRARTLSQFERVLSRYR